MTRTRQWQTVGLVLSVLPALGACSHQLGQNRAGNSAVKVSHQPDHAAGIQWSVPAGWQVAAARPMRVATYRIAPAAGDEEPAECAVYFFGTGQGGSVEANLDRWATQFAQPDGRPAAPEGQNRKVAGLNVHTIRVQGTYLAAGGPMAPVSQTKPNYAMLGAIVEAPQGLVFFKLTGPARTVSAAQPDFEAMFATLRRQ
jgi:hypothetical protein